MPLFPQLFTLEGKKTFLHIFQMFLPMCLLFFVSAQIPADASSIQFNSESILGVFERENEKGEINLSRRTEARNEYVHMDRILACSTQYGCRIQRHTC
jgi:hypothetical protein